MTINIDENYQPVDSFDIPVKDYESAIKSFDFLQPDHVIFGWVNSEGKNTYDIIQWLIGNESRLKPFTYEVRILNSYTPYIEMELKDLFNDTDTKKY